MAIGPVDHEFITTLQAFTMEAGPGSGLGHRADVLGGHSSRHIQVDKDIELILSDLRFNRWCRIVEPVEFGWIDEYKIIAITLPGRLSFLVEADLYQQNALFALPHDRKVILYKGLVSRIEKICIDNHANELCCLYVNKVPGELLGSIQASDSPAAEFFF